MRPTRHRRGRPSAHERDLAPPEFLEREALGVEFGSLGRRALVHGHCHHEAVLGFESEVALLDRQGTGRRALHFAEVLDQALVARR